MKKRTSAVERATLHHKPLLAKDVLRQPCNVSLPVHRRHGLCRSHDASRGGDLGCLEQQDRPGKGNERRRHTGKSWSSQATRAPTLLLTHLLRLRPDCMAIFAHTCGGNASPSCLAMFARTPMISACVAAGTRTPRQRDRTGSMTCRREDLERRRGDKSEHQVTAASAQHPPLPHL